VAVLAVLLGLALARDGSPGSGAIAGIPLAQLGVAALLAGPFFALLGIALASLRATLGVIGLGALGGSVAWRAAQAGVARILGYATQPREAVAAARAGAITDVTHGPEEVVRGADLVILAEGPRASAQRLESLSGLLRDAGPYCTDVAAVKASIVARAEELGLGARFAGSHPLGVPQDPRFAVARADWLEGALVYVTPAPGGEEAAREVADFWERVVGAHAVTVDPQRHDEQLAWTSHLPRSVAAALVAALAKGAPDGVTYDSAALEITREAGADPHLWTEVLWMNRQPILTALEGLTRGVGELRTLLERGDREALGEWLEEGRRWRSRFDT
jgi:prephenate dehydrogenase